MRWFACLFLVIAYTNTAYALDATLRTIILNGRPAYLLTTGDYATEAAANAQKQQLEEVVQPNPVIIDNHDPSHVRFKIGPIRQYDQAKKIQQDLVNFPVKISSPQPQQAVDASITSPSVLVPVAPISPPTVTAKPINESKLWNLNDADIRAVIAEVSRLTGKNFIIDPRVQGKISIVSNTPLSTQALYQVFLSMLQVSGYSAIPGESGIKIIPNLDAKAFAPDIDSHGVNPFRGDAVMISVVPVHYVPAEQLVPVLRPLMPQWSYVSAYAPSNMLILSGRVDNIKQLTKIIRQVDQSSVTGIDVVHLRHALAMDVANTLKDLMKTSTAAGGGASAPSPLSVAVDDRNNAILLSGNKVDRLRLRIIISKLDRDSSGSASNNTRVIYLHYLRAIDAAPILASIAQANFSGVVGVTIGTSTIPVLDSTNPAASIVNETNGSTPTPETPASNGQAQQSANGTTNTTATSTQNEATSKPKIQIIAEPNTNSVIINAPAHIIRILQSVIAQLDIRPAQLLIEAMVVEIDETDVNNLGIQWGSLGQTGDKSKFQPGFAIINSKTSIADFQAQIYALETQRKANILSTPSVVVLDNRQAKILIGKQVSVASTSYPNNASGTTTASPYQTFNRVNVALHLYVRPQITRAGGIQLQIDQGNDTIDPNSLTNTDNPTFNISSIVTSVHINTGDVVVLGGLIEDSLGNNDTSIPVISGIPGIGRLFQQNIRSKEKRVLMVFIRPIILKTPYDAVQISGEKYQDVRAIELADVKSQESFDPDYQATVLPPLHQSHLPIPFMQNRMMTTK